MNVSDTLVKIIGTKKGEQVSRLQVVKKLWVYITEKDLQDNEARQWFTPDKTMKPVFGTEHLANPDK